MKNYCKNVDLVDVAFDLKMYVCRIRRGDKGGNSCVEI